MATLETYLYITAVCEIKLLSEEKHNSKSHYEKKGFSINLKMKSY